MNLLVVVGAHISVHMCQRRMGQEGRCEHNGRAWLPERICAALGTSRCICAACSIYQQLVQVVVHGLGSLVHTPYVRHELAWASNAGAAEPLVQVYIDVKCERWVHPIVHIC